MKKSLFRAPWPGREGARTQVRLEFDTEAETVALFKRGKDLGVITVRRIDKKTIAVEADAIGLVFLDFAGHNMWREVDRFEREAA